MKWPIALSASPPATPHEEGAVPRLRRGMIRIASASRWRTRQQPGEIGLAQAEGQPRKVVAGAPSCRRHKFDLMIMLPSVKPVEVAVTVDAEQHRLAVDHEG